MRPKSVISSLALAATLVAGPAFAQSSGNYEGMKKDEAGLWYVMDKFEEDVLRHATASIKARRSAKVMFGSPIVVPSDRKARGFASTLTTQAEQSVQSMLDQA